MFTLDYINLICRRKINAIDKHMCVHHLCVCVSERETSGHDRTQASMRCIDAASCLPNAEHTHTFTLAHALVPNVRMAAMRCDQSNISK